MVGPPRLVLVLSIAALLLIPSVIASPPTVGSYSTFTLAQLQSVADSVVAVPQVQRALSEGDLLRFVVKDVDRNARGYVPVQTVEGRLAGGSVHLATVSSASGSAALEISGNKAMWGALFNSCDRANTAKLALRDGYAGVDGSAAAKAAANTIRTGRADAQLALVRPSDGQAFPCSGETPTLHREATTFRPDNGAPALSLDMLTGNISGRVYVINTLGGIEAQLPAGWMTQAAHRAFGDEALDTAMGFRSNGGVPAACAGQVVAQGVTSLVTYFALATCIAEHPGASS